MGFYIRNIDVKPSISIKQPIEVIVDTNTGKAFAVYKRAPDVAYDNLEDLARSHGWGNVCIDKYADPTEGYISGISYEKAEEVSREDAGLLRLVPDDEND